MQPHSRRIPIGLPVRVHARRATALALLLALLCGSCASVEFTRDTETSGHFVSKGQAFTILSWDIPKSALQIARENMSDARQPNIVVEEVNVSPHLGGADWLLDIIGWRRAVIRGSWGFRDEDLAPTAAGASGGSSPGS